MDKILKETADPLTTQPSIPKNLFHIAPSAQLPAALQANLDDIAARNPDWKQKIWFDDEASQWVRATFPGRISDAYHRISPRYGACQADFLRYLLIWHFGGVYFDLKSNTARPLDEMIRQDDQFVLGIWPEQPPLKDLANLTDGLAYAQWFLVAKAGHPFLKAVIDWVVDNIESYRPLAYANGVEAVFKLTGPVAYTLAILPLRSQYPHRAVNVQSDGWIYTVLADHNAHRKMSLGHYGQQTTLHVTTPDDASLGYRMEALLFHLLVGIRAANRQRLQRRRERRAQGKQ